MVNNSNKICYSCSRQCDIRGCGLELGHGTFGLSVVYKNKKQETVSEAHTRLTEQTTVLLYWIDMLRKKGTKTVSM